MYAIDTETLVQLAVKFMALLIILALISFLVTVLSSISKK
ncbi:hypothetical protein HNP88_000166 [Methanococcus maripaludis]|jgi:hypothetical protein|uniref:Holin-like toxin n=1 Tax=Methanococcus maripaludis TaxID=39152 RepID=A0A7J9NL05_METMI|nr:hypothetical protein [Methanococcus maripaludis]